MSVVALPRLHEVEAMEDAYAYAASLSTPGTRGFHALMLNRLHERHWALDRTAAGIRKDTIAEFCAAARRCAAEGDQEEADALEDEARALSGPFPFNALGVR